MLQKLFQPLLLHRFKNGTRFTLAPFFFLWMLFIFWNYIVAGAYLLATIGIISYFIIILWHEMGHAILARLYQLKVYAINITWMGGSCEHSRAHTAKQEFVIATGGVIAQAILLALAVLAQLALATVMPFHFTALSAMIFSILINANFMIMLFNLIPLPSFDGEIIFKYLKQQFWSKK